MVISTTTTNMPIQRVIDMKKICDAFPQILEEQPINLDNEIELVYLVSQNAQVLSETLKSYNHNLERLTIKYGTYSEMNGRGNWTVQIKDKEQYLAFKTEVETLTAIEIPVTQYVVSLSTFKAFNLPIRIAALLAFLVDRREFAQITTQ